MSRITNNIIINDFMKNYNNSKERYNKNLNQLATEQKYSQISDSALDAIKSLKLKTQLTFNKEYIANAEDGIAWMGTTDQALDDVVKTLRKIRDLTVRGSNCSLSVEDKAKIAQEVDQLREHLIDVANSKYGDRFIFSGTKTKINPYKKISSTNAADYLNGVLSDAKIKREIGDNTTVDINVTGKEVGFSQLFADLSNLKNNLDSGNSSEIKNTLAVIDNHIENVLTARAKMGARQNRLEMVKSRLEANKINYTNILTKTEGVDVAETITQLKHEDYVYKAALATGARIIQPSLIDFLR